MPKSVGRLGCSFAVLLESQLLENTHAVLGLSNSGGLVDWAFSPNGKAALRKTLGLKPLKAMRSLFKTPYHGKYQQLNTHPGCLGRRNVQSLVTDVCHCQLVNIGCYISIAKVDAHRTDRAS